MGSKYCLKKMPEGIYLQINDDELLNKPLLLEELKADLTNRKIPHDPDVVEAAYQQTNNEPVLLTGLLPDISYKPILRVTVTPDKMKAYLVVVPFIGGTKLEDKDIENYLEELHIIQGIKKEIIRQAVENQDSYGEWLVAEGQESINGENARLVFNFNPRGIKARPSELEDGSVDFYNLNLIQSVHTGMVLVEKIPATPGQDGINVYGEISKAKPGADIRLPQGLNTQIIDNNCKLIATKEGHVVYVNNKVNVLSVYEVKGDVDFSSGNIKYNGNVRVMGNVKNSFSVEATGDIEILGNLEGSARSEGNIQIRKGIVKGKAFAKGNIYTRYIENSTAYSDNDIIVADAVMHSVTKAGKGVFVRGKKGLLVGGRCSAGEIVHARIIGSALGTSTIIEVGIRPELRDEQKEINRKIILNRDNAAKNNLLIKSLQALQSAGSLTGKKSELYLKCRRLQYQLEQEIVELKARKAELDAIISELNEAKVCVESEIHPGVTIFLGGKSTFNTEERLRSVTFYLDGIDIRTKPYNEREHSCKEEQ